LLGGLSGLLSFQINAEAPNVMGHDTFSSNQSSRNRLSDHLVILAMSL
jgi:hypothetical protein